MITVIELSTGPRINAEIRLSERCRVVPLPPLGVENRLNGALALFNEETRAVLHIQTAQMRESANIAEPLIAIVIESNIEPPNLNPENLEAIGLAFGEGFEPFAILAAADDFAGLNIILPRARGFELGHAGGIDLPTSAKKIFSGVSDLKYRFLVDLYLSATQQRDSVLRAVHLYTCLEALCSRRFQVSGVRDAIRMTTKYGYGVRFPLFQRGNTYPIEVDHIAVVGKVRDQIFHGLRQPEIGKDQQSGYELFSSNPAMFALLLSFDCLSILHAGKDTRPETPSAPLKRSTPPHTYRFHLVADENPKGRNIALLVKEGPLRGQASLALWFRDYTGGGTAPFELRVPGGKAPPGPMDKLGYAVELMPIERNAS